LLKLAGVVPVYRAKDGESTSRNAEAFAVSRRLLARGGIVAVFPEGISHDSWAEAETLGHIAEVWTGPWASSPLKSTCPSVAWALAKVVVAAPFAALGALVHVVPHQIIKRVARSRPTKG
jgi:hypothetical protein